MGVRAVIFDIGGVLEITTEMTFLGDWIRRLGVSPRHLDTDLIDIWPAGELGTVTESDVHDTLCRTLAIDQHTADALLADMWTQYLGTANTALIDYLRALRPRYRTGLLSNSFVGARERERAAYGFEHDVDDIVYSHEVGLAKPDPAIYRLACTRLGVTPEQTVFVDDSPSAVAAARALGMTAIHHSGNEATIAAVNSALAQEPDERPVCNSSL